MENLGWITRYDIYTLIFILLRIRAYFSPKIPIQTRFEGFIDLITDRYDARGGDVTFNRTLAITRLAPVLA